MFDSLGIKIGMIFLYFSVSLGGAFCTIYAPPWLLEGATVPVMCALAAGIMMGVALAHLIPEGDDLLEDAVPGYRLAFALVGAGVTGVLCIEHVTIAIISKGHKKKKLENQSMRSHEGSRRIGNGISIDDHNHGHDHGHSDHDHVHEHDHGHTLNESLLHSGDFSVGSRGIEQIPLNLHDHDHQHGGEGCAADHHHSHRHSVAEHNHGFEVLGDLAGATSLRDFVALYALELSVSVHSIILGVDYGLTTDTSTLLALTIALTFHQTIEGIAMGAAIVNFKDKMPPTKIITFMVFFASTISIGVIVGIICSFQGESGAADTLQGVFSSLAAGSLLYVALTEQVSTYFDREDLEDQLGTKLMMIVAFGVGFAMMASLAIWE